MELAGRRLPPWAGACAGAARLSTGAAINMASGAVRCTEDHKDGLE